MVDNETKDATLNDTEANYKLGRSENCFVRLDALLYCYTPANQLGSYYNTGEVNSCEHQLKNLFSCFKLRTNQPIETKHAIIREMNAAHEFSPTKDIWTYRENPSANWNPGN